MKTVKKRKYILLGVTVLLLIVLMLVASCNMYGPTESNRANTSLENELSGDFIEEKVNNDTSTTKNSERQHVISSFNSDNQKKDEVIDEDVLNDNGSTEEPPSSSDVSGDDLAESSSPGERTVIVKKAIYDEYTAYWIICPDKTIAATYRTYEEMQPNLKKFTLAHNHTHNWASEDKCDFLGYETVGTMKISEYKASEFYDNPDYVIEWEQAE